MRMLNTARPRQTFLFCVYCAACPTHLSMWVIAWKVPEATFDEMLLNRKDWLRCVVCLQPMTTQGQAIVLNAQLENDLIVHLGCEPKSGTIKIVG